MDLTCLLSWTWLCFLRFFPLSLLVGRDLKWSGLQAAAAWSLFSWLKKVYCRILVTETDSLYCVSETWNLMFRLQQTETQSGASSEEYALFQHLCRPWGKTSSCIQERLAHHFSDVYWSSLFLLSSEPHHFFLRLVIVHQWWSIRFVKSVTLTVLVSPSHCDWAVWYSIRKSFLFICANESRLCGLI